MNTALPGPPPTPRRSESGGSIDLGTGVQKGYLGELMSNLWPGEAEDRRALQARGNSMCKGLEAGKREASRKLQ